MSLAALAWARKQTTGSSTRKAVLMALADRHNGDTGQCNPRVEMIAEDTELSDRAVRSALSQLTEDGFIERTRARRSDGTQGGYSYTFSKVERRAAPPDGGAGGPPAGGAGQEPEVDLEPETISSTTDVVDSRAPGETWDPRRVVKVEGRNLPWDALAAATGADEMAEKGRLAAALKIIRPLAIRDLGIPAVIEERWAEDVEHRIAAEIRERAAFYRSRWPRMELTPTALAANWSRVTTEVQGGGQAALAVAEDEMRKIRGEA